MSSSAAITAGRWSGEKGSAGTDPGYHTDGGSIDGDHARHRPVGMTSRAPRQAT
jgi:hypothetical protein